LETQLQCSFEERWYFTSVRNDKILKTLRSPAPNGPHFIVKNHDLKKTTCKRCHEDQQIQRGVDVSIITQILKASYQNLCDRIVFVTGDGDFEECIRVAKEECKKEFTVVGFNNLSIHSSITQYASKVLYLDKLIPSFKKSQRPQNYSKEGSKSNLKPQGIKTIVKPKFDQHQEPTETKDLIQIQFQVKTQNCFKEEFKSESKPQEKGTKKFDKQQEEPTETKDLIQIQAQVKTQSEPKLQSKLELKIKQELDDGVSSCSIC